MYIKVFMYYRYSIIQGKNNQDFHFNNILIYIYYIYYVYVIHIYYIYYIYTDTDEASVKKAKYFTNILVFLKLFLFFPTHR